MRHGNEEDMQKALRMVETLHAFLLAQSGIPVLYSGDEINQFNDWSYHEDPLKQEDSRYLHRGNFSWEDSEKRHDPESIQGRIYMKLQELRRIRDEHHVFNASADVWTMEPWNDHILAFGRYDQGEKLLCLFNFSQETETAWLNEPEEYRDLNSGETMKAEAVTIEGCGFRWLYKKY